MPNPHSPDTTVKSLEVCNVLLKINKFKRVEEFIEDAAKVFHKKT